MMTYIFQQTFTGSHVRPDGHDYQFSAVPSEQYQPLERIGKFEIAPLFDNGNPFHKDMLDWIDAAPVMGDLDVLAWHFKNTEPRQDFVAIAEALQPYTQGEIAWILLGVCHRDKPRG
jgi:hypothetical protein